MNPIKPKQDIVPLSDFRANVAEHLKQAQYTGRPIVVTQHGRGAGVLLSAEAYEKLQETIEFMRAVMQGQQELAAGKGIPHDEVVKRLKRSLKKATERHARNKRKVPA